MELRSALFIGLCAAASGCGSHNNGGQNTAKRFTQPVFYRTSVGNSWLALADFNGDHHLDAAMTSDANHWTSIALGKGDGTFQAPTTLVDPNGPHSVAAADFNGDSAPDLVVVDNDATLRVYQNDGHGTFGNANTAHLGVQPHGVITADFNNDGFMDIAAVNTGTSGVFGIGEDDGGISLLYGNGQGAFTNPNQITGVVFPQGIASADINHDGATDFVTVNQNDTMTVFLNTHAQGTAAFSFTGTAYKVGSLPNDVVTADLNGDGHVDVAVANSGNHPNTISVLLNTGTGTFTDAATYNSGREPWAIRAADIDGDQDMDLIVADSGQLLDDDGDIAVFINDGHGLFSDPELYPAGKYPQSLAIGDFNEDGKLDIAVADLGAPDGMAVLINTGTN